MRKTLKNSGSVQAIIAERRARQKGGTAIVVAFLAPILLFGIAFGTEAATWQMEKRRMQNAADVAAYAAATQIAAGYDTAKSELAAEFFALETGYDGGASNLTVEYPPTNAPKITDPNDSSSTIDINGDDDYVYVTLTQEVKRNFSSVFAKGERGSKNKIQITGAAIAYLESDGGGLACIVSLEETASYAINVTGNTTVTLNGCQLALNSSSSQSFVQSGSGVVDAECIQTVGDVDISKSENVELDCGSSRTGASSVADPYRTVSEPVVSSSCDNAEDTIDNAPTSSGRIQLSPGCYEGGYHFKDDYDFNTGGDNIYVLSDGNYRINSSASIKGTGIMIYLASDATIDIAGDAEVDVTAMNTGDYSGIAIFVSRSTTALTKFNGGSDFNIQGALYAPNAELEFSGNTAGSDDDRCTQVIGAKVKFTGNSGFATNCDSVGVRTVSTDSGEKAVSIVG